MKFRVTFFVKGYFDVHVAARDCADGMEKARKIADHTPIRALRLEAKRTLDHYRARSYKNAMAYDVTYEASGNYEVVVEADYDKQAIELAKGQMEDVDFTPLRWVEYTPILCEKMGGF